MPGPNRRKRYFMKSGLQNRYLRLILLAIVLPTFLFSLCLCYLIFYLMAEQLGIPESIAYNLTPVLSKIGIILLIKEVIPFVFQPFQTVNRAIIPSLSGVVKNNVKNNFDPLFVKSFNHIPEFIHKHNWIFFIPIGIMWCEKIDRGVSPIIFQRVRRIFLVKLVNRH